MHNFVRKKVIKVKYNVAIWYEFYTYVLYNENP
jgi:hypothetical protein